MQVFSFMRLLYALHLILLLKKPDSFYNIFVAFLESFIVDCYFTDEIIEAVSQKKESETVLKILLYFLKVLLGNESYKVRSLRA